MTMVEKDGDDDGGGKRRRRRREAPPVRGLNARLTHLESHRRHVLLDLEFMLGLESLEGEGSHDGVAYDQRDEAYVADEEFDDILEVVTTAITLPAFLAHLVANLFFWRVRGDLDACLPVLLFFSFFFFITSFSASFTQLYLRKKFSLCFEIFFFSSLRPLHVF